ncbi:MAG: 2-dehydropantoate 2-reductase [Betaproteobacteria bacterium]|nr:2-dehydropantoate 2-reductase [Betaproteobacteria bacterium]
MKICILGSGALGSAIGGALAEAGADVVLISQRREHVAAMNAGGLRLREDGQDRVVKVRAAINPAEVGPVDLVVVLVKSFDTREALLQAGPIIGPNTTIVSLQNGLGHEDIIAEVVGRDRVIGGKTYLGGVMLSSGHVIAGLRGKETIIGELDGRLTPRLQSIADAFNRAGLSTSVSDNIMGTIWDKLLVNVATGALAGITRLPYGELYRVPEIKACALAAVAEAIAVARACGVKLSVDDPEQPWIKAAAGLPAEFKTSMLQSIEKGGRTEIDFINGAVVRRGEQCGVPTPVNRALVACVRGIEQWMQHFGLTTEQNMPERLWPA